MAQSQRNVRSYGGANVNVYTARKVATPPTPTLAGQPLAASLTGTVPFDVGFLVDGKIEEALSTQATKKYGQGGAQIRELRSQVEQTWQFTCAEWNARVAGLSRPGVIGTQVSAGQGEVQTITITGSPTGGTLTVGVAGYGAVTPAFNAPLSSGNGNLQTLMSNLLGFPVVVTGTAGSSYQVAMPVAQGDVPAFFVDGSNLTGGTNPTVTAATGTQGSAPIYQQALGPSVYTTINNRFFWLDFVDGIRVQDSRRLFLPNAEAKRSGNSVAGIDEDWETPFTLTAYPDDFGFSIYEWTADPQFGPAGVTAYA